MNKITRKEYPDLFEYIEDFIIEDSREDHRRGSNFFVESIAEFKSEDRQYFPGIENFDSLVGFWKTNTYIRDAEYGADFGEIYELIKVERKEIQVTKTIWKPVI